MSVKSRAHDGGAGQHYESRVQEIISLVVSLTIFAIFFVALRFYIKFFKHKGGLWWDDWLILFSLGLSIGMAITQLVQLQYGFGQHIYNLPSGIDFKSSIKIFYYHQIMYLAICGTVKLSILVFYLRLCRELRQWVYFGIAFVSCSTLAVCLVDIFQCTPINYDWDQKLPKGECISRTPFNFSCAGINIASDIYVYVLPMWTLWKIQLPRKQRIGILIVFALGFFVVLTGFLRLHSLFKVSVTDDPTYDNAIVTLWSHTEFNLAIICACLPSLKVILKNFLGTVKNIRSTTGKNEFDKAGSNPGDNSAAAGSRRSPLFSHSTTNVDLTNVSTSNLSQDLEKQGPPPSRGTIAGNNWEGDVSNRNYDSRTEIIGCYNNSDSDKEGRVELLHVEGRSVILKTTDVQVKFEETSPTSFRTWSPQNPVSPRMPPSPTAYSGAEGKADAILGINRGSGLYSKAAPAPPSP